MKYVIITKVDGIVYYICFDETYFVKADADDSIIAKFDTFQQADAIAKRSSSDTVKYEVKPFDFNK